jgi:hypothetical protein
LEWVVWEGVEKAAGAGKAYMVLGGITPQCQSLLDYFITDIPTSKLLCETLNTGLSDHFDLNVSIDLGKANHKPPSTYLTKRLFTDHSLIEFAASLAQES